VTGAAELQDRVIAIAGAGGGLGPTVARRLADGGATLALADITTEHSDRVKAELGLPDERVDARAVDLLDAGAAADWAAALTERFGRIDGLVHLVGGWRGGDPIESFDLADYEFLHDLLVRTVQIATRAFHSALTASAIGRFVLISSSAAQSPEGTNAAYAAAKAAAEAWTLALADSFAGTGATANVIVVNAILTPSMRERNPDKEYPTFTPAEDLAEAIAFVCSDAAERMNGKRLALHP
jgi:NAD(P)-dependent dehydrogenase (short-subunit alcohol dehydrogenase family)